jgi:ABC-type nitrate/sulfonate/bicarbonate transport system substrate-binding protein
VHLIEARKEFIEKHPELVQAFLAGWFESVKYMFDNREKTIAITQEATHTSKSIAEKSYDELMPMYNRTGKFDPEALAVLAKSFVDMQILPSAPDLSNLYTEKFLPQTK